MPAFADADYEVVAAIGTDLSGLEKGLREAWGKVEAMGQGVSPKGVDSFLNSVGAKFRKFGDDLGAIGTRNL